MSIQHALALPEILENIFRYIPHDKDFLQLSMVNYIWCREGVRSLLKLYRNRFYRYKHNIYLSMVIDEFESFKYRNIYCPIPAYNKINWPSREEYRCTLFIEDTLATISSKSDDIIDNLIMIKNYIPTILYNEFIKDIKSLINDYQSLDYNLWEEQLVLGF
jgi:hypothetical protein